MSIRAALNKTQVGDPFAGFAFVSLDEGPPMFVGKVSPTGAWIIQKFTGTAMTYAGGDTGYLDAWTSRASLTYTLPNETE